MALTPALSCIQETWHIPNLVEHFQPQNQHRDPLEHNPQQEREPFLTRAFTITDPPSTSAHLIAYLTIDQYFNFVLWVRLREEVPNRRVIVRLHNLHFFAGNRRITRMADDYVDYERGQGQQEPESDSGEFELTTTRRPLFIDTHYNLSFIASVRLDSVTIKFTLCSKILPSSTCDKSNEASLCEIENEFEKFGLQTLDDFKSLLNDQSTADMKIVVNRDEEKIFHGHKCIFMARSAVFRAMFSSEMKESAENAVVITDINPRTMEYFISFIYCGRFGDDSWIEFLPSLTYAAHKYDVPALKELCNGHLIKSVTCENAIAVANLAECYGLTNALDQIRKFVKMNYKDINFDFGKASKGLDFGE